MEMDPSEKYILCVGMCVFDVIHSCDAFPTEDSDQRYELRYEDQSGQVIKLMFSSRLRSLCARLDRKAADGNVAETHRTLARCSGC